MRFTHPIIRHPDLPPGSIDSQHTPNTPRSGANARQLPGHCATGVTTHTPCREHCQRVWLAGGVRADADADAVGADVPLPPPPLRHSLASANGHTNPGHPPEVSCAIAAHCKQHHGHVARVSPVDQPVRHAQGVEVLGCWGQGRTDAVCPSQVVHCTRRQHQQSRHDVVGCCAWHACAAESGLPYGLCCTAAAASTAVATNSHGSAS